MLAQFRRQSWRGSFLNYLLVAALYAAVPFSEVDGVSKPVCQHLHLNVARVGEVALQEHPAVAERGLGLPAGRFHALVQFPLLIHKAHTAAATSGGRLDQQGESPLSGELLRCSIPGETLGRTGDHGDTGGLGDFFGTQLVPQRLHVFRCGPDEGYLCFPAGAGELRVLRQETVARVYSVGAAVQGGLDYPCDAEVGFFRRVARQRHGLLRRADVGSASVRIGIDRNGGNAHGSQSLVNADCDFASIGHQYLGEHPSTRSGENYRLGIICLKQGGAWHHIRKTPRFCSGKGALMEAAIPSPTTVRVSAGSMMPSSHRRAVL